jgi:hypothetical protein
MKKNIGYTLPFLFSTLVMLVSFNEVFWIEFWSFLNIPSQLPPFSDLDSISRALNAKEEGLNPFIENPYDLGKKPYSYPLLWLYLFDLLNLNQKVNFQIFNFVLIYLYSLVYIKIAWNVNNKLFSILLVILFLSFANLLLLERLNIEVIIFILIYFLANSKTYKSKISIYLIALFAKLYPIFSIFIFLRNKKILLLMIFFSFLSLFVMKDQIMLIMKNSNELSLNIAYGIPTLTKGMWYYSTEFGYLINDNNYKLFKYTLIFLASVYALILFLLNFKFGEKNISNSISIEEKLFICGGGIFIGRFLNFSNIDYSLIFLIFTIPYFFKDKITIQKLLFFICLILSFNSIWFEFGDRYTYLYLCLALFIHTTKIIIFSVICYNFGKIVNEHLKIKFS